MQKNKTVIFKLWLPVFLYAGFIFYMSSLPMAGMPPLFPYADKLIHLAEYTLLGWLLAQAIKYSFDKLDKTKLYYLVIFICFLYGISDEFHQSFVVTRTPSAWDVLADTIGGFLGAFLFL
jgi:VanZ family protein